MVVMIVAVVVGTVMVVLVVVVMVVIIVVVVVMVVHGARAAGPVITQNREGPPHCVYSDTAPLPLVVVI